MLHDCLLCETKLVSNSEEFYLAALRHFANRHRVNTPALGEGFNIKQLRIHGESLQFLRPAAPDEGNGKASSGILGRPTPDRSSGHHGLSLLRLRLRAPVERAGKLSAVTVGGKPWKAFDAQGETVDFAAEALVPELLEALKDIVASWGAPIDA